jgi:hypothetical protein
MAGIMTVAMAVMGGGGILMCKTLRLCAHPITPIR